MVHANTNINIYTAISLASYGYYIEIWLYASVNRRIAAIFAGKSQLLLEKQYNDKLMYNLKVLKSKSLCKTVYVGAEVT